MCGHSWGRGGWDELGDYIHPGLPCWLIGKEFVCNAGDTSSIPGMGRSPGEGNGSPLQYSYLENPMDRGACQATIYGVTRVRLDLATKPPPPPQSTIVACVSVFFGSLTTCQEQGLCHLFLAIYFVFLIPRISRYPFKIY